MRWMRGWRTITALTLLILLTTVVATRVANGEEDGAKKGPTPIRVLLVTGGHLHDLEFYSLFHRPELRVTVDPHPAAFTGDIRQRYDVVVLYDMVRSLDEQRQQIFAISSRAARGWSRCTTPSVPTSIGSGGSRR